MVENVVNSEMYNILISGHALIYVYTPPVNKTEQWRLNNSLLGDGKIRRTFKYFTLNMNSGSSIQIVWEAFKITFGDGSLVTQLLKRWRTMKGKTI